MSETNGGKDGRLWRLAPWLLVGGLVLFHAANNWIWLAENVTWTGWDKPRHLAWSLNYAQLLGKPSLQSLFQVMASDPIRPPFFTASAFPLYALFGRSADVATMINVIYMAVALAATYGIGRRWGGRGPGLASVALLAFFPMFYSMSRYFYLEFAMTAMVALAVFLLLASDGFQRRDMSLLFGLSLGLGLLTKRTFALFAIGPVLVVVLGSGLLPDLWRRVKRRPTIHWKSTLLAVLGGLAVTAIWYLPNREVARTLPLGDALFFCWWALAALAIYFASLPSAPLANALAALFLAAGLASTWYLARIDFLKRVALYGYGIDDPRGRALRLDSLDTYLYYLRRLGNEHLSFLILIVLAAIVAAAVLVYARRQGSIRQALRHVRLEGWTVLAWATGSYILLSLSIYQETRAFTAALPAVALILGAALFKLPWRRLRLGLLALLLAFGLLQFFAISYEPVQRLLPPLAFRLPIWGQTTSFAQGVYIQLPDEGETDRGYWIVPDVLERMEARRLTLGRELLSLGLLVNSSQVNAGPFNYLILTEYPQLRLESLIERFDDASPYTRLFAHDYVAVKRDNYGMNPAQEQVIEAILSGPPSLFAQAFELETSYTLPDGDSVYLYRQRYPLPADYPAEYVTRLAGTLGSRTRSGDAILLTPPQLAGPFVASYDGPAEIYLAPKMESELAAIAAQHRRLFLVVGDATAGQAQDLAQAWLNQHAFRADHEWSDSLQLITYGTVAGEPAAAPSVALDIALGDAIQLVGHDIVAGPWFPGDIVPLTLFWRGLVPVAEDYNVFVHLLDENGGLLAQNDSAPAGGSRPTSLWEMGETITDRRGLLLPDGLPPGEYQLRAGIYLPATGERLVVANGEGDSLGDSLSLGLLAVRSH